MGATTTTTTTSTIGSNNRNNNNNNNLAFGFRAPSQLRRNNESTILNRAGPLHTNVTSAGTYGDYNLGGHDTHHGSVRTETTTPGDHDHYHGSLHDSLSISQEVRGVVERDERRRDCRHDDYRSRPRHFSFPPSASPRGAPAPSSPPRCRAARGPPEKRHKSRTHARRKSNK